jgi:hypothetical protein
MKKPKVSFRIFGESGPLTISWSADSKGPAIEAKSGAGVGFFSKDEKLLAVEFDDVAKKLDQQLLRFESISVEIKVKDGNVKLEIQPTRKIKKGA